MDRHSAAKRNDQMDNIKCLLIFSVVFGHMLELFMGKKGAARAVYLIIYSFHMPLFAFVSGVYARFDPVRIRNRMIYPYIVFQTLYILFSKHVLGKELQLQYTTPYWLLWYLFAMIIWTLILPLMSADSVRKKLFFVAASFAAAVLIGFDNKAGYYLSFSRIVEFFPFFLLGHYSLNLQERTKSCLGAVQSHRLKIALAAGCAVFILLAAGVISGNEDDIRSVWLYGASSYEKADYGWKLRSLSLGVAAVWLGFLLTVIPVYRIPFLSFAGANTMPVYLLHGFVIRYLKMKKVFDSFAHPIAAAFALSVLIIAVLSSRPAQRLTAPFFSYDKMKGLVKGVMKTRGRKGGQRTGRRKSSIASGGLYN